MSVKERKIVLSLFFVVFLIFRTQSFANTLGDEEKTRLYDSLKGQRYVDLTIDVSLSEEVVTMPELVNKIKQASIEETKILRKKSNNDSITLESVGIALPGGSEIRLTERRIRIGSGLKIRNDTTIFANKEKTKTNYEATTINTGFRKDSPSYEIDHKLKRASIWSGRRWSGRKVLRFGKVDEGILMDIVRLSNPKWHAKLSKKNDFSYKGTGNVDGKIVDGIECIDPNGKVKYSISLDTQDWRICRKIVWYDNKSGLASKIVEYKQFAKAKGSGELFPRLVIRRHFDKEGKEEKAETINITDVVIGLPISDDVFKFDVPTDYTIIDNREK